MTNHSVKMRIRSILWKGPKLLLAKTGSVHSLVSAPLCSSWDTRSRGCSTKCGFVLQTKDYLVPRFSRLVRPSRLQFQRSLRNWYWHSMMPRRMASRKVSAKPGSLRHSLFCLRDSFSKSHCFTWTFPWAEFVEGPSDGKCVRASFPVKLKGNKRSSELWKTTVMEEKRRPEGRIFRRLLVRVLDQLGRLIRSLSHFPPKAKQQTSAVGRRTCVVTSSIRWDVFLPPRRRRVYTPAFLFPSQFTDHHIQGFVLPKGAARHHMPQLCANSSKH